MAKMRTLDAAYDYIKSNDPGTSLHKYALRRMVLDGTVPSVMVGKKYLVDVDKLEAYLGGGGTAQAPASAPEPAQGIRPIGV